MTWLGRYRIKRFLQYSVWLPPLLGLAAALLAYPLIRKIDLALGLTAVVSPDSARAVLAALASSMLTFIVFVFSILLLAVQLASAQLTPRIIATFYRSGVLKLSLSAFVFAFTFSLAELSRIEGPVPQVSLWVAVYSCVACIGVFLYMIDHVGKSLRPVSVLTLIGNMGREVIGGVYPLVVTGSAEAPSPLAPAPLELRRIVESKRTGVVLALDVAGLAIMARRTGCLIEFVPQVGDFVTLGDPLFRLYPGADAIDDHQLEQAVAIGPERTMEQDPEFAFRIIVDIAAKALSPAVNDPTTAVLALDQIHRLLREVSKRRLDTGQVHDSSSGRLLLAYRTPDWDDFVSLAVTEIRQFGRDSIQIVRRLRAMLDSLIESVPAERAGRLRAELDLLGRGVGRAFPDPEDRIRAAAADSLGVGGSR